MNISPVSFKSLMVFTLPDGKPKAPVQQLVRAAFNNNEKLKSYKLDKDITVFKDKMDGTVYNANQDFCALLDEKYQHILPKGSKRVVLTEAEFSTNPRDTQKRYYITAATNEDEDRIHNALDDSKLFYTARFKSKLTKNS